MYIPINMFLEHDGKTEATKAPKVIWVSQLHNVQVFFFFFLLPFTYNGNFNLFYVNFVTLMHPWQIVKFLSSSSNQILILLSKISSSC